MKLKILKSSSAGNGYLLDNGKEALLIECGVDYKAVQRAVNFDISRICGCLVSHEHGDHAKAIKKVLAAQIPCYMSKGTAQALQLDTSPLVTSLKQFHTRKIGGFMVQPFCVQHDAAEPFGFLIYHHETGLTLFATDTYYLKYKFKGLSNVIIECNYRKDILEENLQAGIISQVQYDRTLQSHMSYDSCKMTLSANDLSQVNNIVLIHLSPSNSHAAYFREGIAKLTGKSVHIASPNTEIEFNKTPF